MNVSLSVILCILKPILSPFGGRVGGVGVFSLGFLAQFLSVF